jgi:hypothetical protein
VSFASIIGLILGGVWNLHLLAPPEVQGDARRCKNSSGHEFGGGSPRARTVLRAGFSFTISFCHGPMLPKARKRLL